MASISTAGFQPRTIDKVERLLDLVDEMQRHPDLKGKLAMHGGTAINLFMLDVPRLSVDIDVSYIGALSREEMLAERPAIERAVEEVGRGQGYSVSSSDGGHAGRTFVLQYRGDWGHILYRRAPRSGIHMVDEASRKHHLVRERIIPLLQEVKEVIPDGLVIVNGNPHPLSYSLSIFRTEHMHRLASKGERHRGFNAPLFDPAAHRVRAHEELSRQLLHA